MTNHQSFSYWISVHCVCLGFGLFHSFSLSCFAAFRLEKRRDCPLRFSARKNTNFRSKELSLVRDYARKGTKPMSFANWNSVYITIRPLLKLDFRHVWVWRRPDEKCLTILKKGYKFTFNRLRVVARLERITHNPAFDRLFGSFLFSCGVAALRVI
jgi:hypothetical protein